MDEGQSERVAKRRSVELISVVLLAGLFIAAGLNAALGRKDEYVVDSTQLDCGDNVIRNSSH